MAIALQGQTNTNFTTSASTTITKPSGFTTGEILVAHIFIQQQSGSTPDFLVPSGWTAQRQDFFLNGGTYQGIINTYWKLYNPAVDGPASNYTFTTSNSIIGMGGCLLRISGANTTAPFGAANGGQVQSSTTFTISDTITPPPNCLILMPVMTNQTISDTSANISGFAIATDNPTWTRSVSLNGFANSVAVAAAVATATRSQSTATGSSSGTLNPGFTNPIMWTGQLLAIRPQIFITITETLNPFDVVIKMIKITAVNILTPFDIVSNVVATVWSNLSKSATNLWNNINKS